MTKKGKPRRQEREDTKPLLKVTVDDSYVTTEADPKSKRTYVTVNAFAFALNQAELRFKKLEALLLEFHTTQLSEKPLGPQQVTLEMGYKKRNEIVALAWDVIDWLERTRKIFGAITGVPKKNDFYSSIMKLLEPAETFRQILQHYDSEVVRRAVTDMYPIMGSVIATFRLGDSWSGRVLLSTPARFIGDKEICVAGAKFIESGMKGDIDGITLSVTNHAVNISEILHGLEPEKMKLSGFLEQNYNFQWPNL